MVFMLLFLSAFVLAMGRFLLKCSLLTRLSRGGEAMLLYLAFFGVICMALGLVEHYPIGKEAFRQWHWPMANPFQVASGLSTLGLALAGMACLQWKNENYLVSVIVILLFVWMVIYLSWARWWLFHSLDMTEGVFVLLVDLCLPLINIIVFMFFLALKPTGCFSSPKLTDK